MRKGHRISETQKRRLNNKLALKKIQDEIEKQSHLFKLRCQTSKEVTKLIETNEDLECVGEQVDLMFRHVENMSFKFEDFGFEAKPMEGIDKINLMSFIIAHLMFSESKFFDGYFIDIVAHKQETQWEFKARLLQYIYANAVYLIKNPPISKNSFDWSWNKTTDLIVVTLTTPEGYISTRSIHCRYDVKFSNELLAQYLVDFSTSGIYFQNKDKTLICKITPIEEDQPKATNNKYYLTRIKTTLYCILSKIRVNSPTNKGYLPLNIIRYIMFFVEESI